mgnify:CR=1 FL=1
MIRCTFPGLHLQALLLLDSAIENKKSFGVEMRNLILCLALGAVASSAFALTNEDLAANTWMPLEEQTKSSCELPAMIDFHKDGTLSS